MIKKLVYIFLSIVVSACTTKATITESTPSLIFEPPPVIALTVIDNREYVVSGDKKDNFEGFHRLLYGIPITFADLRKDKIISYADRIAQLFVRSFENAGSTVVAVKSRKGSRILYGIENFKKSVFDKGVVICVNESKIDAGGSQWQYFYDYDFVIVNLAGDILLNKKFSGRDVDFQRPIFKQGQVQGKDYDFGSILSIHYKNKLSQFINDRELSQAIANADYATPAITKSSPEPLPDIEERLLKLKSLLNKGIISESEYKKIKKDILDSL